MEPNINFFAIFNQLQLSTPDSTQNTISISFDMEFGNGISYGIQSNKGASGQYDEIHITLYADNSHSTSKTATIPYLTGIASTTPTIGVHLHVDATKLNDTFLQYGFAIDYVQSDNTPLFIHAIKDTTNGTTPNTVWVNAAIWLPPNSTITEPYCNINNIVTNDGYSCNLIELDLPDYSTIMQSNYILQGFPRFNNPMIILEAKDVEIETGVALKVKGNNGNNPVVSKSYGSCISAPKVTGTTS